MSFIVDKCMVQAACLKNAFHSFLIRFIFEEMDSLLIFVRFSFYKSSAGDAISFLPASFQKQSYETISCMSYSLFSD